MTYYKFCLICLERSPNGAARVAAALEATAAFLSENPLGGLRTSRQTLFVKIVPDFSYKMFYRLTDGAVEIVHIRHSARRPWLGEAD